METGKRYNKCVNISVPLGKLIDELHQLRQEKSLSGYPLDTDENELENDDGL